ncbi:MAG: hypothetical protein C0446_08305 [Chitinophaga sp.]|nr:hypothetical protein [Chitinophaga sp.]
MDFKQANAEGQVEVVTSEVMSSAPAETQPAISTESQTEVLHIGESLTQADIDRIYAKLGRPESFDKYDLSGIAPSDYNQEVLTQFKQKAFENGMSNEGVRKMAEWYKEIEVQQINSMQEAKKHQAEMWKLQVMKEWGSDFEKNVQLAVKARDAYTDADFRKYMDETGLGNHPSLLKAFAQIGRELSEDKLVQSETASRIAADEAANRREINRLRSDKSFMDMYRRGDTSAIRRLHSLYGIEGN